MRTTTTTVYTLDELTAEARAAAIEYISGKLTGEWWDSADVERITETIVYDLAAQLTTPGWDTWGVSDFPGIDGVKLEGWDIERGQCVLFDGTLDRANAPALPWVDGIESVHLTAHRDHTTVYVDEAEADCTCPDDGRVLVTHQPGCPFTAPNPATDEQRRALTDAVRDAMSKAWQAGYDEGEYIGSESYAVEHIESNERLFHDDGTLYTGPPPDDTEENSP